MSGSVRRILIYTILLLLGYVGVRVGLVLVHVWSTPVWKQRLGPPEPLELPPTSPLSEDLERRANRILVEILYGPEFGEAEYNELAGYIRAPVVNLSALPEGVGIEDLDTEVHERGMTRGDAITAISERLRVGAPIDPAYLDAFVELLVSGMYQDEDISLLDTSVFHTVYAGLADHDGPHRDRVLEIIAAGDAFISPLTKRSFHAALEKRMRERGVFERPLDEGKASP